MAKNTLVVLTRDPVDFRKKLAELNLPDLEVIIPKNPDEAQKEVAKANILLGNPPMVSKHINAAKSVVWVQSTFAGIDALNEPMLRKDYALTNVRDAYGEAMAEYVFSYILLIEKEMLANVEYQKQKIWQQRDVRVLRGKTICIIGAGSIGKCIAKIAKAFNMNTLGYRAENVPVEYFDEIFTGDDLKDCLPRADYIVSVLPRTKDTTDIINAKRISFMKQSAVFMNIGRGNAVNEPDLIQALKERRIAKAVLDVFKEEPLPKESPFWSMDNVYVTPHLSGYVLSEKIFEIFAENYKRFLRGDELMYRVDFTKGY